LIDTVKVVDTEGLEEAKAEEEEDEDADVDEEEEEKEEEVVEIVEDEDEDEEEEETESVVAVGRGPILRGLMGGERVEAIEDEVAIEGRDLSEVEVDKVEEEDAEVETAALVIAEGKAEGKEERRRLVG
jgi:hypothetical protein